MRARRRTLVALVLAGALPALAGCTSSAERDGPSAGATTGPAATEEPGGGRSAAVPLDQERLDELVRVEVAAEPSLAGELVAVLAPGRSVDLASASGVTAPGSAEVLGADATVRIASVTKTFTAAAVWRLVEQGELDVEATLPTTGVPDELVDLLRGDGYDVDRITVRHLLTHTSGIADHADDEAGAGTGPYGAAVLADPDRVWTPAEQVRFAVEQHDPLGVPGAGFRYSDTGYVLLGQVLEAVTGLTYAAAMRSLLRFDDLGLDATHLESVEPVPDDAGPRAAQLVGDVLVNDLSPTSDLHGGGGLVASMADVATFFRAVARNEVFDQPDTFDLLSTAIAPGTRGEAAAGIYRADVGGHVCWFHEGFFGVLALTCPSIDVTIARSWNQAAPSEDFDPADLLLAVFDELGVEDPPPVATATPAIAEELVDRPVALAPEPCPESLPSEATCGLATVPLDWTRVDGSEIEVWFGHQPSSVPSTGTVVPFLGGPGGALSTALEDLQPVAAALPDRDVLFVDIRGVGRSGRLACPSIDEGSLPFGADQQAANAACAEVLGPARDSYRTVAVVLDIEAIRRSLDLPPPSLLAFSYGTFVATTYAVLFPSVVRAAVLDGGLPLTADELGRTAASNVVPVARRVCARTGACDPDAFADDLRAVARSLQRRPQPIPGEERELTEGLLAYIAQAYLPQGSRAFLDAVALAADGDPAPLIELARPALALPPADPVGDSYGLGAAVICNDYRFPYELTDPPEVRREALAARLSVVPADVYGPFSQQGWLDNSWDHPDECLSWPAVDAPEAVRIPALGPFPDVPVLVLNGDLDLQTPLSSALATAAQLPNSVLVEVVNAPHAVIPASGCALRTALAFLDTAVLPSADACADEPLPPPAG